MNEANHSSGSVTRDRLLEAAGEIFAEKGLHGTTIREITQRAGANIASINYHFQDKFNLYVEVLRRAHASMLDAMSLPLTADTPEGRLRQLLSAALKAALNPARPQWQTQLLSRELVQPTPALDPIDDLMRPASQRLWDTVRELRPDFSEQQLLLAVAGVVSRFVFHVYHGHILRRMFPSVPKPDPETLAAHVVDFSLAALRSLPATSAKAGEDPVGGQNSAAHKRSPSRTRKHGPGGSGR